jgi:hypothetical protein
MWPAPWPASSRDDTEMFGKARLQALNLIQWLARIANSYVNGGRPEERIAINFRADGAFVTKTFDRDISLEMRLPTLEMQFLEHAKPVPHILDPDEHTPAEVEAWILVELLHRGMDRDKFSKTLPYTIANLMSGDAEDYSPKACAPGLSRLSEWFRVAASVLSTSSKVICLPQTLMLVLAPDHSTATAGFSPGDAEHPEPYFFARKGTKRCLLTASELANETDPAAVAAQFVKGGSDVRRA